MSTTTRIDATEVQHVVHAAIAYWGANIADCTLPEGESEPGFDRLDEIGQLLRACKATDTIGNLGEPFNPPDFAEMNLRAPRVFDALRHIVFEWQEYCSNIVHDELLDLEEATAAYWLRAKTSAEDVLELIDGEKFER